MRFDAIGCTLLVVLLIMLWAFACGVVGLVGALLGAGFSVPWAFAVFVFEIVGLLVLAKHDEGTR